MAKKICEKCQNLRDEMGESENWEILCGDCLKGKKKSLTKKKSVAKKKVKKGDKGEKKPAKKTSNPTKKPKRGRPTKAESATIIKAKREKAVELLVGFSELSKNRTMEEIAAEVGIDKTTLYLWIEQDDFQEMCDDLIAKERKRLRARVDKAFINRLIEEGDAQRMKLFLMAFEGWVPTEKQEQDVTVQEKLILKKSRVSKKAKEGGNTSH